MKFEPGDPARIIQSTDGISVGKRVQCLYAEQELHYQHGVIWMVQCETPIMTEYGSMGHTVHVPEIWLEKIVPPSKADTRTLEKEYE